MMLPPMIVLILVVKLLFWNAGLVAARAANQFELREKYSSPRPFTYVAPANLPKAFSWVSVGGRSLLTRSMNQHLEQYCGSCFVSCARSLSPMETVERMSPSAGLE
jgi:hypothetical protein